MYDPGRKDVRMSGGGRCGYDVEEHSMSESSSVCFLAQQDKSHEHRYIVFLKNSISYVRAWC